MIDFGDGNFASITIAGVTYIQENGELRKATQEELEIIEARRIAKAQAKAERKANKQSGGISLNFGDIAGGDIININIKK